MWIRKSSFGAKRYGKRLTSANSASKGDRVQTVLRLALAKYETEGTAPDVEEEELALSAQGKAHQTAIGRKSLSNPAKHLKTKLNALPKDARVLDYGCGKGADVEILSQEYPHLDIQGYDPVHRPEKPKGKFDLIMCNYVLNVVPKKQWREEIIDSIYELLKPKGVAYVSVRADLEFLKGVTSKGTYQGYVKLKFPVEEEKKGSFVTYKLTRNNVEELRKSKA